MGRRQSPFGSNLVRLFNLSLVEKPLGDFPNVNRNVGATYSIK
jgi:hypothetical protein